MKLFLSLCRYEWKKLWLRRTTAVSFAAAVCFLAAMTGLSYYGSGSGYAYQYDAESRSVERVSAPYLEMEEKRREFLQTYNGAAVDDALLKRLAENYADSALGTSQWNLNDYAPFLYLNTLPDPSDASADDYYDTTAYLTSLQEELSEEELAYWSRELSDREPVTLTYCGGWIAMVSQCGLLSFLTMLVTGISLCPVFSQEHGSRVNLLTLSSAEGRSPLFAAKLTAGGGFAVLVPVVLYAELLLLCSVTFGLSGFSAPLRLWSYAEELWDCSIGQYSLIMLALLILASVMQCAAVCFLSEAARSPVPAVLAALVLTTVPLVGFSFASGGLMELLYSYLPTVRVSTATLSDSRLAQIGPLLLNCLQASPLVYFSLAAMAGVLCFRCYRRDPR